MSWVERCYDQGSEACRNYSRLTMRVRTISQQVLILGVVGISVLEVDESLQDKYPYALLFVGIALIVFAISLALVDWHYQSAFSVIRNQLARIECENEVSGPWLGHLFVRTYKNDHFASYLPFVLLAWFGCIGLYFGHDKSWLVILFIVIVSSIWFAFAILTGHMKDKENKKMLRQIVGNNQLAGGYAIDDI